MGLAFLTFITGIAISVVAIYYSVLGLAAIFAAAVIPIIVMGSILEVSKLVTAWWLKANWHRAPWSIKIYLTAAVVMLMLITSMGIFGFLSKAHTDQAVPLGDTASQVAFIDEKINNERETIASARVLIKQLDDAVIGIQTGEGREIRLRDGTTRIENPAERALSVRRSQAADRATLTKTIEEAQARIVKLQEEKAPIASQLRAVEAEVGPIKYIAKLIYGDNPDQNLLEKAVVWVIIIIVLVFDPLAVLLLLASQMSFQWARKEQEEQKDDLVQTHPSEESRGEEEASLSESNDRTDDERDQREHKDIDVSPGESKSSEERLREDPHPPGWAFTTPLGENNSVRAQSEEETEENSVLEDRTEIINEAEPTVDQEIIYVDDEILDQEESSELKEAMHRWKIDNPSDSLKHQRYLFNKGIIDKLPWEDYLKAKPDFEENEAAEEAAKWALEQLEESKKKDNNMDGNRTGETGQEDSFRIEGYVQNAEQNDSTIWQKVKKAKNDE
jgi:flagellar basal body-associated protein FliL